MRLPDRRQAQVCGLFPGPRPPLSVLRCFLGKSGCVGWGRLAVVSAAGFGVGFVVDFHQVAEI